jgi:hypothetical protein
VGWLTLVKSTSITHYIASKSNFSDNVTISSNGKILLSIFIVFLALSSLLNILPVLISSLWEAFKKNAGASSDSLFGTDERKTDWLTLFLRVSFHCLMIVFCRQLTDYFSKNIHLEEG